MADLTTGRIPKASGATVIADSAILDDGSRVTFTTPVIQRLPASATPGVNTDMAIELTSNTTLTIRVKGNDGTVRSVALTLA